MNTFFIKFKHLFRTYILLCTIGFLVLSISCGDDLEESYSEHLNLKEGANVTMPTIDLEHAMRVNVTMHDARAARAPVNSEGVLRASSPLIEDDDRSDVDDATLPPPAGFSLPYSSSYFGTRGR